MEDHKLNFCPSPALKSCHSELRSQSGVSGLVSQGACWRPVHTGSMKALSSVAHGVPGDPVTAPEATASSLSRVAEAWGPRSVLSPTPRLLPPG